MKLFSDNRFFKNKTYLSLAFLLILLQSQQTYIQFGNKAKKLSTNSHRYFKITHTFFLIGDAGNADEKGKKVLNAPKLVC
jgi:hypothetical protein